MPNCKEHEDCDLVCSECGSYYCQSDSHDTPLWLHRLKWGRRHPVPTPPYDDMPDDIEAYRNERAEENP